MEADDQERFSSEKYSESQHYERGCGDQSCCRGKDYSEEEGDVEEALIKKPVTRASLYVPNVVNVDAL